MFNEEKTSFSPVSIDTGEKLVTFDADTPECIRNIFCCLIGTYPALYQPYVMLQENFAVCCLKTECIERYENKYNGTIYTATGESL